jgi:hypothetical protein
VIHFNKILQIEKDINYHRTVSSRGSYNKRKQSMHSNIHQAVLINFSITPLLL